MAPKTTWFALMVILASAVAAACADPAHAPAPTPSETPQPGLWAPRPLSQPDALSPPERVVRPSPTPTATPLPPLAPTAGVLVYLRGDELWAASLDGGVRLPPRRLARGEHGLAYAGYVRTPSGIDLYYARQLTASTGPNITHAAFAVYRVPLEGGAQEELLRYTGRALEHLLAADAAISPDGRYLAYADRDGLALADLSTGQARRILDNGCTEPGNELSCWAYHRPEWSPDGAKVALIKGLWEDGVVVTVDPDVRSPMERRIAYGSFFRWSPDSRSLCLWEGFGINSPVLLAYELSSDTTTDIFDRLPLPEPGPQVPSPDTSGCAWASDGRLGVMYAEQFEGPVRAAVLDRRYTVLSKSDPLPGRFIMLDWLPDGSGVVVNRTVPEAGPIVVAPGREPQGFPFEVDWALAVIP